MEQARRIRVAKPPPANGHKFTSLFASSCKASRRSYAVKHHHERSRHLTDVEARSSSFVLLSHTTKASETFRQIFCPANFRMSHFICILLCLDLSSSLHSMTFDQSFLLGFTVNNLGQKLHQALLLWLPAEHLARTLSLAARISAP